MLPIFLTQKHERNTCQGVSSSGCTRTEGQPRFPPHVTITEHMHPILPAGGGGETSKLLLSVPTAWERRLEPPSCRLGQDREQLQRWATAQAGGSALTAAGQEQKRATGSRSSAGAAQQQAQHDEGGRKRGWPENRARIWDAPAGYSMCACGAGRGARCRAHPPHWLASSDRQAAPSPPSLSPVWMRAMCAKCLCMSRRVL